MLLKNYPTKTGNSENQSILQADRNKAACFKAARDVEVLLYRLNDGLSGPQSFGKFPYLEPTAQRVSSPNYLKTGAGTLVSDEAFSLAELWLQAGLPDDDCPDGKSLLQ